MSDAAVNAVLSALCRDLADALKETAYAIDDRWPEESFAYSTLVVNLDTVDPEKAKAALLGIAESLR